MLEEWNNGKNGIGSHSILGRSCRLELILPFSSLGFLLKRSYKIYQFIFNLIMNLVQPGILIIGNLPRLSKTFITGMKFSTRPQGNI